jgi:hypothetical protein
LVKIKRSGHTKVPVYKAIGISASYNPSSDTVLLTLSGNQAFAKGGQITIVAAPPSGLESAAGVFLVGVTQFTVSPGARSVTPV